MENPSDQCVAVAESTGRRCQRQASMGGRCGLHRVKLPEITARNDRVESLQALRQVLADAIEDGPEPRYLASLTKQLMAVMAELEQLTPVEEKTVVDDLAARRAERRTTPAGA